MIRLAKWLSCLAAFAGAVLFGTANSARADIQLTLTNETTGASASGVVGNNNDSFTGSVGDLSLTIQTAPVYNGPGDTNVLSLVPNAYITNLSTTTAETLQIVVTATGFTDSPGSSLAVTDMASGTVTSGSITNASAQGFADASNSLDGTGFASTLLSIQPDADGSFSASGSVDGFSPSSSYSLTFVETFTLSAGGSITLTGGSVDPAVPEPASLMAAFTAVPFLGLGAWLRRVRSQGSTV
jgi:hypothetical protein